MPEIQYIRNSLYILFSQAIQWGIAHERDAIQEYETTKNVKVSEAGIFLHKNGYLGASPDGLISVDKILEIKCPFKVRHS
jgi:YqaJ-like viral recombinase domain